MKILFLGGSGNISTDCAALLHQRGHEIIVVGRGHRAVPPEYRFIKADRSDLPALRSALHGLEPDVVINFIGYDLPDVQVDCDLFAGHTGQYIFISSATVYKKPAQLPITEAAPLGNPWWDYAQKKLRCEQWLLEQHAARKFPVTIVRPSHTYSHHWIPNLVTSSTYTVAARMEQHKPVFLIDDGQSLWTLTATSDFAIGLAGLAGNPGARGEAFHITSDEALTWNQIYNEIGAALGARQPQIVRIPTDFICQTIPEWTGNLKGDKAWSSVFDNTKLKRLVPEFDCRKSFHQGVRESVAWLRAHPEERRIDTAADAKIERLLSAWAGAAKGL